MSKIKGITLHRPWSAAIAYFGKDFENRTWAANIPVGWYLAIHAGSQWDDVGREAVFNFGTLPENPAIDWDSAFLEDYRDLSKGSIIAVARFGGNLTGSASPWFAGPIGWKLEDVTPISPVQVRGQQGLWDLPEDVLRRVRVNYANAKGAAKCQAK